MLNGGLKLRKAEVNRKHDADMLLEPPANK